MSFCNMRCGKCDHEADYFDFTKTEITGELPNGTFQCPSCKRAFTLEKRGESRTYKSGLHIPAERSVVTIPSFL